MPYERSCALAIAILLTLALGCEREAPQKKSAANDQELPRVVSVTNPGLSPHGPPRDHYTLAVSIYTGWMPWYYAEESGLLAKWGQREGIHIELVSMNYIDSIEAFVTGRADACTITNMEALGLPAAAGIDSTVLIIGDYSNGNDKILVRGIDSVAALRGVQISLVELSVSDYLLSRALEQAGLSQQDVRLLNTGSSQIGAEFIADKSRKAVVTWNPIANELERQPGVRGIYDSGQIPGEILDLCIVNSETLARDPRLGRALVGAWFEALALLREPSPRGQAALAKMAELSGCSVADFRQQLDTTYLFWDPTSMAEYARSDELKRNMKRVGQFCFTKNLLGEDTHTVDDIGIEYPDGSVQGRADRVKLRFNVSFAVGTE